MNGSGPSTRLDKWLWHARFFRTRGLATKAVAAGDVRINGTRTLKPAHPVSVGDTLTFALADTIRLVRIDGIGLRRGPTVEAQQMYHDLDAHPVAAVSPLE